MKDRTRENLSFAEQLKLALSGLNNDKKQQTVDKNQKQLNLKQVEVVKISAQKSH